jgi:hypothetical protein
VWKFVPGLDYKFGLILEVGIWAAVQPQRTATNGMASLGNCKYIRLVTVSERIISVLWHYVACSMA